MNPRFNQDHVRTKRFSSFETHRHLHETARHRPGPALPEPAPLMGCSGGHGWTPSCPHCEALSALIPAGRPTDWWRRCVWP